MLKQVRNPWGQVPITAGGKSLPGRAHDYMDKLLNLRKAKDIVSRRHHYVPQTYLRQWSFDGKRVWALDTVSGTVRPLGLSDVCVAEHFYRVVGPDNIAHNRVELLFGVVDTELRRVQSLLNQLEDPDELEFDDLIALGITMAVQRMRTLQERRLQRQYNAWLVAQNPRDFKSMNDPKDPHLAAGIHTESLFSAMWHAADVLTTRQIEVWDDPQGRFMTCDTPVLVPFRQNIRPNLLTAPYIVWPVSPHRVVALSNNLLGEKAILREANGKLMGIVRNSVEQGRERMIFASEQQRDRLPRTKKFRRRTQTRLRCSQWTPQGQYVEPPGCCLEQSYAFATGPDIALCSQGLHSPAPDMWSHK
ncbi:DUF4238 domain-containing protein [Streptosporangium sp. NPDC051022]|uniref:DUF4238 domain-containing protein n=1 Tax=Streptosporangium sp. NPDC051022 TaxID=3155752 RepID=UPI0034252D6A